jgi:hypothetical protein
VQYLHGALKFGVNFGCCGFGDEKSLEHGLSPRIADGACNRE